MSSSFKQLEAPERYYNNNGVPFGYVVRVQGFSRTTYLNFLNGMQQALTVPSTNRYGFISAVFETIEAAHETAYKYYRAYHEEYGFKQDNRTGKWIPCETTNNCLKTVESQIMRFK